MQLRDRKIIFLFMFLLLISNLTGAEQYRLHTDDQLAISVWGHSDLQLTVVIDPDGKISFPLVGSLSAEGLTVEELTALITEKLSEYIKDPVITINLQSYYKLNIMVMGEVKNPGTVQLKEGKRVIDALALTGGATELADLSGVKLTRGGQVFSLNMEKVLRGEKPADNYLLADGDVVFIPESTIEVTVFGQVRQPGRYDLKKGLKLTDLIALAGGLTEKAGEELEYSADGRIDRYNIQQMMIGNQEKPLLKDGDTVYIPEANYQVFIQGEVNRPGSYRWHQDMRLAELLAQAGNQTTGGNLKEIRVTRRDNSFTNYNLEQYLRNGRQGDNPYLNPGDAVFVARGNFAVTIQGEVKKPGSYPWHEGLKLAGLLAEAGNPTEYGEIKEVKIVHQDSTQEMVNLSGFFEDGKVESNPYLQPGDTVYIPKGDYQVTVLGEVNRPGSYPWYRELKLSDLLAQAGNEKERGDLARISIIDQDGTTAQINLKGYFEAGTGPNPLLQPGDTVRIEEVKGINWPQVFSFVAGFKLLKDFLEIDW